MKTNENTVAMVATKKAAKVNIVPGANVNKIDPFAYARKKDGTISTHKLKVAAGKELDQEMGSISGAIKQVNSFGGEKLENLLKHGKFSREQVLSPKFLLTKENYERVPNCYFKGEEAWYKYTVKVNGENTTVEKLRSKWSGKLILAIIAAAIK